VLTIKDLIALILAGLDLSSHGEQSEQLQNVTLLLIANFVF